MQTHGYIFEKNSGGKILLLVRQCSYYRLLKKRSTGKDGYHFEDEEIFLNEVGQKDRLEKLKNGEVISC